MKSQSQRESGRPVVDEAAFQQLLSAAYVMQEHNTRLKQAAAPKPAPQAAAPVKAPVSVPTPPSPASPIPFPAATQPASATTSCQECGSPLAPQEFFCENCGAPVERSSSAMQKSWSSLWEMHQASESDEKVAAQENSASSLFASKTDLHSDDAEHEEIDLFPAELEEIVGKFSEPEITETKTVEPQPTKKGLALVTATPQPVPALTVASEVNAPAPATWTSAAKARAWFDSLKAQQPGKDWFWEEWKLHRGTIAIALASAVLMVVIFQWATQPATSTGQTRELSGFEQVLVSLGLAEAPTPAAAPTPGNPDTKVWVDVHTALYYCPGAELYGKTSNGKYTSQLDAQRDHFQPSTLKACD